MDKEDQEEIKQENLLQASPTVVIQQKQLLCGAGKNSRDNPSFSSTGLATKRMNLRAEKAFVEIK